NMTEFAFSGLGLNPHYGTPLNPWDRATGRIPGGSSSGAAVSVTDAMAFAAAGTDTGGACPLPPPPAGLRRLQPPPNPAPPPRPPSRSLDCIGPLANSVACCAALDAVLAGQPLFDDPSRGPGADITAADLHLCVLTNYVTDGLEAPVAAAYGRALRALADAGI